VRNHFPDVTIQQTESKFEDTRNYRVDSEKAEAVLGFVPRLSIDEGIEQVKALLVSRRLRHVDNPRHSNQGFLSSQSTHLRRAA